MKLFHRLRAAFFLGSLVFGCPAFVLAEETYCPESISVTQTIEKVPEGWTAGQDEVRSTLAGITFFSGPPNEGAALVFDKWKKHNGMAYGVWHFQRKSPYRIWLSCRYSFARVVLSKQLPADTTECIVTYDPKELVSGDQKIRNITCH